MTDTQNFPTWDDLNKSEQNDGGASGIFGGYAIFPLIFVLLFVVFPIITGCGSSLENVKDRADQFGDVGREVENVIDQGKDVVEESGEAIEATANTRETAEAAFGSESACFSPVLDAGDGYSMKFAIPGREFLAVRENGNREKLSSIKIADFETADLHFPVSRFASFMQANLLVRVYDQNGESVQASYEKVGDVYSKKDFGDKSCATALVYLDRGDNVRISAGD